jgi:gas vesicle protein
VPTRGFGTQVVTDSATYLSAVAALVGTFVGGITSIATSWLGQQRQTKELRRARAKAERQALYKQFILDASKLYTDALEHNTTEITELVDIYATLNRIRVLSSPKVIAEADNALRMIVDTYAKENTTFSGIRQSIGHGFPDPLRAFSEACHEDLKMY